MYLVVDAYVIRLCTLAAGVTVRASLDYTCNLRYVTCMFVTLCWDQLDLYRHKSWSNASSSSSTQLILTNRHHSSWFNPTFRHEYDINQLFHLTDGKIQPSLCANLTWCNFLRLKCPFLRTIWHWAIWLAEPICVPSADELNIAVFRTLSALVDFVRVATGALQDSTIWSQQIEAE